MKTIDIVGAGFSGLTLAYHLQKQGLSVRVFERDERVGGLISTIKTPSGTVETAANALLADADVEDLFRELDVAFADRLPQRKNRYIFWEKPSRWPLGIRSTLRLTKQLMKYASGSKSVLPRENESVFDWACRFVDAEFEERLLAPALQGVFAGDTKALSASLVILGLTAKRQKSELKGSVAPAQGMSHLMEALRLRLENRGVTLSTKTNFELPETLSNPTVLCTSAWSAAEIVKDLHPTLARQLKKCVSLPLVSATTFFEANSGDLEGFGCLFPVSQGFNSLGVLFNSSVFVGRSDHRSETWIMGGAHRPDLIECSDEQILTQVRADRRRLTGRDQKPLAAVVTKWPKALPNYSLEWEAALKQLQPPKRLYLHGNYLGALSLARINAQSILLAQKLKEAYG